MSRHLNDRHRVLAVLVAVAAAATIGTSAFAASAPAKSSSYASQLAAARLATTKYATNLAQAKADGYGIITQMIPSMGWHFMNPKVTGFDLRKPAILVYPATGSSGSSERSNGCSRGSRRTRRCPAHGTGSSRAACHYVDGTFIAGESAGAVRADEPAERRQVQLLAPPAITLHVWLWYPNPSGLYSGTNPLAMAYDHS